MQNILQIHHSRTSAVKSGLELIVPSDLQDYFLLLHG